MGRILAIDYGTKRTGIAVTDTLQIIANPLTTVPTAELMQFLSNYFEKENVEMVVIGEPIPDPGAVSKVESHIKGFLKKFREKFPTMAVDREDERFTTQMAHQSLLEGGAKKKTRANKELVDAISAAIILQSYMGHR